MLIDVTFLICTWFILLFCCVLDVIILDSSKKIVYATFVMGNSYVRQLKKVGVWRGGVRGWGVGGGIEEEGLLRWSMALHQVSPRG